MTHVVGWRDGDDAFLGLGRDPADLAVYSAVGPLASPSGLYRTKLRFPNCLRFMPYAEPVIDLVEIDDARAERYRSRIVTPVVAARALTRHVVEHLLDREVDAPDGAELAARTTRAIATRSRAAQR